MENPIPNAAAFPRQFARSRRFSLGVPRHLTVSPDGRRILFVRTGSGTDPVGRLWQYEDGAERILADPALLVGARSGGGARGGAAAAGAEPASGPVGVVTYATDDAARLVAFALSGALWAVRTDGGAPFSVPAAGPVVDPRPSPDGRHIAYVSRRFLPSSSAWTAPTGRLARAEGPEITYGLAEYVGGRVDEPARAATGGRRTAAMSWSPGSTPARWNGGYLSDPSDPTKPPQVDPLSGRRHGQRRGHRSSCCSLDGDRVDVRMGPRGVRVPRRRGLGRARPLPRRPEPRPAHAAYARGRSRDRRHRRCCTSAPTPPGWSSCPGTPARTASGSLVLPEDTDDTRYLTVGGRAGHSGRDCSCARCSAIDGEQVLFVRERGPHGEPCMAP